MKLSVITIHRAIPTANTAAHVILFSTNPQICWLYQRWTFVLEMEITRWDAESQHRAQALTNHANNSRISFIKRMYTCYICVYVHMCMYIHAVVPL